MALPARKQVPQDNDGNTTEPKLHTREQQMHASLPDKSLEPQSRRHASLHPVMHANANNQHNQSTNSRLQQSQHNASTPALHATTPSPQRLQANNSQRVVLKPVERMHQPPKVSLKPASSIGNNATNKIKAEKVLHKLDENPRQLHANIPRMQPENTKLDDDLQQMDDELLGDEDVVDLEDLIDTEHTTPEYSYESDAFDTPVPDDGFDDDNESSDTDELDDALPEDSLDNAYNDYEQSDDTESDIDNNDDYIDDVSDESPDDYYDDNDDYIDDIDDDTDSDDDYLDDDSDNNEESYDDDYIDDTDDDLEPSLQDDTANNSNDNNVNNNSTASNANTTPDNSISEPSDPTTNDDNSEDDNESKPTVSGFKAMLADFKKKIKNEIGDNNDDTDDSTDDSNKDADKKNDKQKPDENDDDQKPDDKPTIDNKSPLTLILSIITLPFKALMFTLRTASKIMRIAMSAVSMLTVFALIWLILNIPVALHTSSADFDNDEGTLTAESVKYDNGSITFTAVNNSDMIAHADITGSVKAWKPFKRIPVSLFAPVKVMDCTTSYVDMNPNESKEITIQCTGDTGLWMRPTVHITGE